MARSSVATSSKPLVGDDRGRLARGHILIVGNVDGAGRAPSVLNNLAQYREGYFLGLDRLDVESGRATDLIQS